MTYFQSAAEIHRHLLSPDARAAAVTVACGGDGAQGWRKDVGTRPVLTLGAANGAQPVSELDACLPWQGLPLDGVHEISGPSGGLFTVMLMAALLNRSGDSRPVLWCQNRHDRQERGLPWGGGLAGLGVPVERLLFAFGETADDTLWAMEEGLASGAVAAVIGNVDTMSMTATRRLQLAASRGGAMAVLLREGDASREPSAALTRWHVAPQPSPIRQGLWADLPEPEKMNLTLWRCRGGAPKSWVIGYDSQAFCFSALSILADRPDTARFAA